MFIRLVIGIAAFAGISLIGFFIQMFKANTRSKEIVFLNTYFKKLVEFNNGTLENYAYLIENLNEAQRILGNNGILAKVRMPYENGYHLNVPVLSFLSEVDKYKEIGLDYNANQVYRFITEAFLRTFGDHDRYLAKVSKDIKNIFIDFYNGFSALISSPFIAFSFMLAGRNVFKSERVRPLVPVFKSLAVIIQLVSILSGVITIFLGWSAFWEIIKQL